jgi:hypothetical protein
MYQFRYMPKLILAGSFNHDDEWGVATIVDDPDVLKKSASSKVVDEWGEIEPKKNASLIHLVALGAHEATGTNQNGDSFTEEFLKKAHPTFKKHGALFRDHKAKDFRKKEGDVEKTAYNDDMRRAELLVSADHDKCADWLGEIEKGKRVDFSMGFDCVADHCSICDNRAPTRKDYCFVPGTEITIGDGSVKPIELIEVGDAVMDAGGNPTKVVQLFKHNVDEDLVVLKGSLFQQELIVTDNHPVLALPAEMGRFYNIDNALYGTKINKDPLCEVEGFESFLCPPAFVDAGKMRQKDFIFAPVLQIDDSVWDGFCDEEEAWIYGLFTAEGSFAKDKDGARVSIQFSLHQKETWIIERLQSYFKKRYDRDVKTYSRETSKGISVRIHSREAALVFFEVCGEYATQKTIDERFFHAPEAIRRSLLEGIYAGDGHIYFERGSDKLPYSRINSASKNLIRQLWHLTSQMGCFNYVGHAVQVGGPTNRTNKSDSWYLASSFLGDDKAQSGGKGWFGGMAVGHLREVSRVRHCGPVFNFETESHTYVANGIAVHNCDHVKKGAKAPYGMGKILPDGRKCFVFNPEGVFNDISKVGTGADMIAQNLRKVAGVDGEELIGGAELMEIVFPDVLLEKFAAKMALAQKMSRMEKIIPVTTIRNNKTEKLISSKTANKLRAMPAGMMFGELAKAGCLLPLRDFFSLVMGDISPEMESIIDESEKVASLALTHAVSSDKVLQDVCSNKSYECSKVALSSLNSDEFGDLSFNFGLDEDLVNERLLKQAMTGSRSIAPCSLSEVSLPALKMLEEYAAYKLAVLETGVISSEENSARLVARIS